MKQSILSIFALTFSLSSFAKVEFIKPKNNEVVPQSFDVEFAVQGMTVAKAGDLKEQTGHHHIIVDGKSIEKGMVVPKDESHIHFGDGSSKTTLKLKPGKHTLTLQFADGVHKSFGEAESATITVEVK